MHLNRINTCYRDFSSWEKIVQSIRVGGAVLYDSNCGLRRTAENGTTPSHLGNLIRTVESVGWNLEESNVNIQTFGLFVLYINCLFLFNTGKIEKRFFLDLVHSGALLRYLDRPEASPYIDHAYAIIAYLYKQKGKCIFLVLSTSNYENILYLLFIFS